VIILTRTNISAAILDNDERIMINSASEGAPLSEFTRARFLQSLNLSLNINTDEMILSMVEGLKTKVERLTDSEWDALKMGIPLETRYDYPSNVDVVPADEDIV
jgi:hypothetical protein